MYVFKIHTQKKRGGGCQENELLLLLTVAAVSWLAQLAAQLAVWTGNPEPLGSVGVYCASSELWNGTGRG